MKLAIIGTAGRGEDAAKLDEGYWRAMVLCADNLAFREGFNHLVSGGAAWADHVAVELRNREPDRFSLELHLPGNSDDAITAARYHNRFSRAIRREDTWLEVKGFIMDAVLSNIVVKGGFKDRNTRVANSATHFLAMTFGHKAQVKDGGTKDTVEKMLAQGKTGWHLDLHSLILHEVRA